jgi:hypothetical protein
VDTSDATVTLRIQKADGIERWVRNEAVFQLVEASAPASAEITGPDAYKQAKVGDTVYVEEGGDMRTAGFYRVTRLEDGSRYHRVAIDYEGRNNAVWWVNNERVTKVIPALAQAA